MALTMDIMVCCGAYAECYCVRWAGDSRLVAHYYDDDNEHTREASRHAHDHPSCRAHDSAHERVPNCEWFGDPLELPQATRLHH